MNEREKNKRNLINRLYEKKLQWEKSKRIYGGGGVWNISSNIRHAIKDVIDWEMYKIERKYQN